MESAEVVIVDGGVIGASIACHLAARGCTDVRVLERGARAGEGSTGKATGGFRAQFGSEVNVRLSLLSLEKLLRFPRKLGVDPGYRPCGYLFLADSAGSLGTLLAAQAVKHAAGLAAARTVDPREALAINPAISVDGVVGGHMVPHGRVRPPAGDPAGLHGGRAAPRRSPDRHALLGPAPGVENLYLANGSSGHGVMHSPAIGQLVAEMILDGAASSLDVHALRPSRFAEGEPIESPVLL
jgi:glycine/D-amino acid oxidase-like deaminating enzyme